MNASGAFSLDQVHVIILLTRQSLTNPAQLMELAGLACAQTVEKVYRKDKYPRVLVCCGPGNQGRSIMQLPDDHPHTSPTRWRRIGSRQAPGKVHRPSRNQGTYIPIGMFGYKPTIYMPKVDPFIHSHHD